MSDSDVAQIVSDLIRQVAPGRWDEVLQSDTRFDENGLHFDSIARVDLLAEIDLVLGVTMTPEVVANPELTVGALIEKVLAARR